jgi:hypothetical protein
MLRFGPLALAGALLLGACADLGTEPEPRAAVEALAPALSSSAVTFEVPVLVVTVRAQGSNRFGHLYWEGATPSVSFDVFRDARRITTVSGSTTGNNFYTDSVKKLRGTFTYKVCYKGTNVCSNSVTVVYDSSTETIRYAPECPTTGTATCIVTLE